MFVKNETFQKRMANCKACDHFVPTTGTCGTIGVGTKVEHEGESKRTCGCVMKLKCKLRLGACPLGKWHRTISDNAVAQMAYIYEKYRNVERLTPAQIREILPIYESATGKKIEMTTCAPCLKHYISEIGLALKQI